MHRGVALLVACGLVGGCTLSLSHLSQALGPTLPPGQPHPALLAEPDRWVLIENPRYQPGDPEGRRELPYVWAQRDRLPLTADRLIGGIEAVLAPPAVEARYAGDKRGLAADEAPPLAP